MEAECGSPETPVSNPLSLHHSGFFNEMRPCHYEDYGFQESGWKEWVQDGFITFLKKKSCEESVIPWWRHKDLTVSPCDTLSVSLGENLTSSIHFDEPGDTRLFQGKPFDFSYASTSSCVKSEWIYFSSWKRWYEYVHSVPSFLCRRLLILRLI